MQTLATLRDPASGQVLDRGIVLRFPAPASFTGVPASAVPGAPSNCQSGLLLLYVQARLCRQACLPAADTTELVKDLNDMRVAN